MFETLRKRIRGILGAGAIWGTLGGIAGSLLGLAVGVLSPGVGVLGSMLEFGGGLAFVGLLSGIGFGGILAIVAARAGRDLKLGPARGALLGMLGALTLPAVIISQIPTGPRFAFNFLIAIASYAAIGAVGGALFLRAGESLSPPLPNSDSLDLPAGSESGNSDSSDSAHRGTTPE